MVDILKKQTEQCGFCGAMFTPPDYFRPPSSACLNCYLWIWGQICGDDHRTEWEELTADEQFDTLAQFEDVFRKALGGRQRRIDGKA